ncbi:hypothetical protein BD626DRAFT_588952 [Schizophyllum amplum]|uniref:Fungal-type protein kinase domain-containing protein n=1 Tax=Schizophyllum amplum TaxID=97359 RepID=A0A550BRU4_9AGAR|nr:hypothetical protein BD626DRAFT_588952 [Auriculariopsis ampla]
MVHLGYQTIWDFPDDSARKSGAQNNKKRANEREIFRPLGRIIEGIVKSLQGRRPTCKYVHEPYETQSDTLGGQNHIDGCLQLLQTTSPPLPGYTKIPTADVAVNFGFKISDSPEAKRVDRWKVVYPAYHNMHSDCGRTHTYSVTAENDTMAAWTRHAACRSAGLAPNLHAAKSADFNLSQVRTVVAVLANLLFSNPEDLGYDSNIKRIIERNEHGEFVLQYLYRVAGAKGPRFFKTVQCIAEYGGLVMTGRATRAWEVVEVHSFDNPTPLPDVASKVLRDVWLNDTARTESEIQQTMFALCDALACEFPADDDPRLVGVDEETKNTIHRRLLDKSYKDLFLTIEADSGRCGAKSRSVPANFTPVPNIFARPVYVNKGGSKQGADMQRASGSISRDTVSVSKPVSTSDQPRAFECKQRNFVVYKEVCKALDKVEDLHEIAKAMLDCLLAVQILFLICWIHRDISSGNLLSYKGHGKLGDLEYAKEFNLNVGGHSDPKTGTPFFMAVEIEKRRYLYIPPPSRANALNTEVEEDDVMEDERAATPQLVRHNFQHDLESFFWILVWLILTHIPNQASRSVANTLFQHHSTALQERENFLTREDDFLHSLACLRLDADLPRGLHKPLGIIRQELYYFYMHRELRHTDMGTYAPVYLSIRSALTRLANIAPPGRVALQQPPPPPTASKSGHQSSTQPDTTKRMAERLKNPDIQYRPHMSTQKRTLEDTELDDDEAPQSKRHAHH